MCVAIVAPKGVSKKSDFLKTSIINSEVTNRDGMGFAFKKNGQNQIYISKGYYNVESLIDTIIEHDLDEEDELIIHTRNGNIGERNSDMCHPFVANAEQILANHTYVSHPVLIHNGTFTDYVYKSSNYSDTYHITKEIFSDPDLMGLIEKNPESFKKVAKDILGYNRLAILSPNRDVIIFGSFIEDNGYLFSNSGYKDKYLINRGGNEYRRNSSYYSELYDDDEYDYNCSTDNITFTGETKVFKENKGKLFEITADNFNYFNKILTNPIKVVKGSYINFMGLLMYASNLNNTLISNKIIPDEFNFNKIILKTTTGVPIYGYPLNTVHKIESVIKGTYGIDYFYTSEYKPILNKFKTTSNYITCEDFNNFQILPKLDYNDFWESYFSLIKEFKGNSIQISELLKAEESIKRASHFSFKKIKLNSFNKKRFESKAIIYFIRNLELLKNGSLSEKPNLLLN